MSSVADHELCGSAGGPGICASQGAVQRTQPCNSVWMYRRHRGPAARRLAAVLPVPRPLRKDGGAAVSGESGKIIEYFEHVFEIHYICTHLIVLRSVSGAVGEGHFGRQEGTCFC